MDNVSAATVIFIAGPTAAGKSGAALRLAEEIGGEIVNADAMQVYADLRILTARPSEEDEARAPHHLYGAWDGAARCSAGQWARKAASVIAEINERARPAILVGGTGLYFKALEDGLSPIPDISDETRRKALARHEELGAAAFKEEVVKRDPEMARLATADRQRLVRAWEVFEETGEPLSSFQAMARQPLVSRVDAKAVIEPARDELYRSCDARAAAMLEEGAIEEVRALVARNLAPSLPVMKALGVPEVSALLRGEITRAEALSQLQQSTRRFAKRQLTWFRNQTADWPHYEKAAETRNALLSVLGRG